MKIYLFGAQAQVRLLGFIWLLQKMMKDPSQLLEEEEIQILDVLTVKGMIMPMIVGPKLS